MHRSLAQHPTASARVRPGRSLLRVLGACSIALCGVLSGCGSSPARLTDEQVQRNLESVDFVHARIKERHFDPAKVGPAWDQAHAEARQAVAQSRTMPEARAAMSTLIASLQQSHFGLIAAEAYAEAGLGNSDASRPESGSGESGANAGIDLRVVEGEATVTRVTPGSSAEQAGLRPGDLVRRIDGRSTANLIDAVGKIYEGKPDQAMMLNASLVSSLQGAEGSTLRLSVVDSSGRERDVSLRRTTPSGTPVKFGHLPTMFLSIDEKRLTPAAGETGGPIGYLRFDLWFDPVRVNQAVTRLVEGCADCSGVVIDLRGNIGGLGAMAMGVGGWFIDRPNQRLGELITRENTLRFVVNPRPRPFTGPLAILIDPLSVSTSEIFAGGMQDLGRARIFGQPTPGAALPSTVEVLPNGDRLQYAFANYVSFRGEALEGSGVQPDERVEPTRRALQDGRDEVLDAAVRWIRSNPAASTPPASPTASTSNAGASGSQR